MWSAVFSRSRFNSFIFYEFILSIFLLQLSVFHIIRYMKTNETITSTQTRLARKGLCIHSSVRITINFGAIHMVRKINFYRVYIHRYVSANLSGRMPKKISETHSFTIFHYTATAAKSHAMKALSPRETALPSSSHNPGRVLEVRTGDGLPAAVGSVVSSLKMASRLIWSGHSPGRRRTWPSQRTRCWAMARRMFYRPILWRSSSLVTRSDQCTPPTDLRKRDTKPLNASSKS